MSAQVDFTWVVRAGKRVGLEYIDAAPQGTFLHRLGWQAMFDRLREATGPQTEFAANRTGMLELVKPGGLGDFVALVQAKRRGPPRAVGFRPVPGG